MRKTKRIIDQGEEDEDEDKENEYENENCNICSKCRYKSADEFEVK